MHRWEGDLGVSRYAKTTSVMCEIAATTSNGLANEYSAKYGPANLDSKQLGGLIIDTATWKADGDTVSISYHNGSDIRGNPVDSYTLILAASKDAAPPPATANTLTTSFDCSKARSDAEHLICSDPELAADDVELAGVFAKAKASASDQAEFKQRTRQAWNDRERICHDRDCLIKWYADQKSVLSQIAESGSVDARAVEKEADAKTDDDQWMQYVVSHHRCEPISGAEASVRSDLSYIDTPEKFAENVRKNGHPNEAVKYHRDGRAAVVEDPSLGDNVGRPFGSSPADVRNATALLLQCMHQATNCEFPNLSATP